MDIRHLILTSGSSAENLQSSADATQKMGTNSGVVDSLPSLNTDQRNKHEFIRGAYHPIWSSLMRLRTPQPKEETPEEKAEMDRLFAEFFNFDEYDQATQEQTIQPNRLADKSINDDANQDKPLLHKSLSDRVSHLDDDLSEKIRLSSQEQQLSPMVSQTTAGTYANSRRDSCQSSLPELDNLALVSPQSHTTSEMSPGIVADEMSLTVSSNRASMPDLMKIPECNEHKNIMEGFTAHLRRRSLSFQSQAQYAKVASDFSVFVSMSGHQLENLKNDWDLLDRCKQEFLGSRNNNRVDAAALARFCMDYLPMHFGECEAEPRTSRSTPNEENPKRQKRMTSNPRSR